MGMKAGGAALALAALALAASLGADPAGDFKLIVNSANPVTALRRDAVKRMFLRKATTWASGQPVAPVDQRRNAPIRRAFSESILDKEPAEIAAYWNQQIFSGRSVPPPAKASDSEVLAYVRDNANAIGYVSADAEIGEGVRIIPIVD